VSRRPSLTAITIERLTSIIAVRPTLPQDRAMAAIAGKPLRRVSRRSSSLFRNLLQRGAMTGSAPNEYLAVRRTMHVMRRHLFIRGWMGRRAAVTAHMFAIALLGCARRRPHVRGSCTALRRRQRRHHVAAELLRNGVRRQHRSLGAGQLGPAHGRHRSAVLLRARYADSVGDGSETAVAPSAGEIGPQRRALAV
jgi:hypothetical protein